MKKRRLQFWISKRFEKLFVSNDSKNLNDTILNRSITLTFVTTIFKCIADVEFLSQNVAVFFVRSAFSAFHRISTFAASKKLEYLHDKFKPSMIMFFFEKSSESFFDSEKQRSFLIIEIDFDIFVNQQVCDCRKKNKQCFDSSVEHKSNTIEIFRYSIAKDFDVWNVAVYESWQQKRQKKHKIDRNLKWIKIRFENIQNRVKFADSACACKKNNFKPLDKCIKGHRGVFGKMTIFYVQKLAEYNNRHNLPHLVKWKIIDWKYAITVWQNSAMIPNLAFIFSNVM